MAKGSPCQVSRHRKGDTWAEKSYRSKEYTQYYLPRSHLSQRELLGRQLAESKMRRLKSSIWLVLLAGICCCGAPEAELLRQTALQRH